MKVNVKYRESDPIESVTLTLDVLEAKIILFLLGKIQCDNPIIFEMYRELFEILGKTTSSIKGEENLRISQEQIDQLKRL